jgi:hypothetical protein
LKWARKWTNGRLNLNPRKILIITIVYVVLNQMEKITGKRTIVAALFKGVQFK